VLQQPRPQPGHLGAARDGGDPKFAGSQELPDFPTRGYAELIGLTGVRVDDPDDVGRRWDRGARRGPPGARRGVTDPEVPPLPPHITLEQAKAFACLVAHGDPAAAGMVRQAVKQKAQEFLPGR
jgi:pyruvate dehydrogenase (quinone)